jgi:hypothetical protein
VLDATLYGFEIFFDNFVMYLYASRACTPVLPAEVLETTVAGLVLCMNEFLSPFSIRGCPNTDDVIIHVTLQSDLFHPTFYVRLCCVADFEVRIKAFTPENIDFPVSPLALRQNVKNGSVECVRA